MSDTTSSPTARSFPGNEEDEGLMMRDKGEREEGSIGKAGAVERGVTKPKRRLSR